MNRWLRTKRAIYVVLLCAALIASGYAIYNQLSSDSQAASLAAQVSQICHDRPELARAQNLNCAQAQDVKDSGAPVLVPGPRGEKGDKGDKGDAGKDGQSIMGPPGVPGATGDRGMNGNPGIDGKTVVGPAGPEGPLGPKGEKGDKGDKGETGDRGADGEPGKDAPTPTSQKFVGDANGCELQTTYSDGTVLSASAPEVMCI